jgi:hypothetical protein
VRVHYCYRYDDRPADSYISLVITDYSVRDDTVDRFVILEFKIVFSWYVQENVFFADGVIYSWLKIQILVNVCTRNATLRVHLI